MPPFFASTESTVLGAAPGNPNPAGKGGCRSWVVGLGTAFGDDRVGWEVVARVRGALPPGVLADATSDPLAVLDAPPGCGLLVVIDACHGAGPPGSHHRFAWPAPQLAAVGEVSSHGVGLATALELATALGRFPQRVVVFAIEGETADPGAGLSPAVEAAVPEVVSRVLAELAGGSVERLRSTE